MSSNRRFDQNWAFRGSEWARWLRLVACLFGNGIKSNAAPPNWSAMTLLWPRILLPLRRPARTHHTVLAGDVLCWGPARLHALPTRCFIRSGVAGYYFEYDSSRVLTHSTRPRVSVHLSADADPLSGGHLFGRRTIVKNVCLVEQLQVVHGLSRRVFLWLGGLDPRRGSLRSGVVLWPGRKVLHGVSRGILLPFAGPGAPPLPRGDFYWEAGDELHCL